MNCEQDNFKTGEQCSLRAYLLVKEHICADAVGRPGLFGPQSTVVKLIPSSGERVATYGGVMTRFRGAIVIVHGQGRGRGFLSGGCRFGRGPPNLPTPKKTPQISSTILSKGPFSIFPIFSLERARLGPQKSGGC